VIAKASPSVLAAWPVKTASTVRITICRKMKERLRPSSRPCSSWNWVPLNQLIQISPKTTAKSTTPAHETSSARTCASWPTSTT
jgi:hypothetical protein